VPQDHWKITGVDQAQAAEAARVLTLYFNTIDPAGPLAIGTPLDKAPIDAGTTVDAEGLRTSHEGAETAKWSDASAPRQRVVLAEHVIIRIGTLVHESKLEQAASLATALADSLPGVAAAAEVNRALTDASVTAEDRTRIIDEQTAEAKKRLDAMLRDAKLRQRLDPDLLTFAKGEGYPATLGVPYNGPWPANATSIDGGVLLSILVTDATDATRDALVKAGLRVESADKETRVVVGVAPLGKLADISVVDGVRKVEATR
jgi:hypothetical protein